MFIPAFVYITILWVVLLVVVGWAAYMSRRHHKNWGAWIAVAVIGAIIFCNTHFPTIYEVTACGKFKKMVMLAPKQISGGIKLEYGNHCYINNISNDLLHLQNIVYGSAEGKDLALEIAPGTWEDVPAHAINFLFIEPPRSISVSNGSKGEMKYWLYCDSQ